ncbi:MAG: hypothetical protein OXD43_08045 [Bacteroidetes bacterium]|nr:hypothetical protein [Bacteroidota bacterium]
MDPITGKVIEAEVVEITKEDNNAIILKMADGAILRLKMDVAEVVRFPSLNAIDETTYAVRSNTSVTLLDPPRDHLI